MKSVLIVATLLAALLANPGLAQQGPAGVPGVFGLVDSVLPAPPPPTHTLKHKSEPENCLKAKDVAQCEAEKEAKARALEACKGKTGAAHNRCMKKQAQVEECQKSTEPARCMQYLKTRELCRNKLGQEHRQCLRDNLTSKK